MSGWGRAFLLKVMSDPKYNLRIEVMTITVEIATEMMVKNNKNRPPHRSQIELLKEELRNNRYKLNGIPIIISDTGVLLDGQHRLLAVIETGIPIVSLVVYGVSEDAFDTIDNNIVRRAPDVFFIRGFTQPKLLASALGWLKRLTECKGHQPVPRLSTQAYEDLLKQHPRIQHSLEVGVEVKAFMVSGLAAALHYLCRQKNATLADTFFHQLAKGTGLQEDSPAYMLRTALIANAQAKRKLEIRDIAAMAIKAWNAAANGQTLKVLRFTKKGKTPESFPEIL